MELINVEELCEKLQNCSSKEQVYRVWEKAKLTNDCSMFVIGNASNVEFVEGFNDIFSNELVCDYFQSKKIQFVNNSIINKLENKKVPEIFIDYSLMFDSNICTYINAIMKRKEFEGSKKIVPTLIDILHKKINYDFTFYLYESSKDFNFEISHINNSHELWSLLGYSFQENLLNLIKFKHIKPEDANSFQTSISESDAKIEAMDLCFKVYVQAEGLLENIKTKFKMIELTVLKIINIQFDSKKSHQNKFLKLVEFMNDKHCFSDRESILAIEYFKDKNLEVFKGIYKEMKIDVFSKKVKNISWDLMAPRIMEDFIKGMTFEKDVFIPFFVSHDSNLRGTIRAYPIKYVFLNGDRNKRRIVSVPMNNTHKYLYENNCHKAIKEILENKNTRRGNVHNIVSNLDNLLACSYRECEKTLELKLE